MRIPERSRPAVVVATALLVSPSVTSCAAVVGITDAPTATVAGVLPPARATAIAAQVIGDSTKVAADPGPEAAAARAAVFTGDALTAANAAAKLAPTVSQEAKDAAVLTPTTPVVLAVSRGLGYPRAMIVQTTLAKSGLPVLYLLTTPDVRTRFKIAASAPMLPSASVKAFDPTAQGSPELGDASGLSIRPDELVSSYAASLAFPPPASAAAPKPFADDSFAAGVRSAAQAQNQALNGTVTYTQEHSPKDVVGGLRVTKNQGALVFTVIRRKDTLVNKASQPFKPGASFTALTGLEQVKTEASLSLLEFVVFYVPDRGPAVAVAADGHYLNAASGT